MTSSLGGPVEPKPTDTRPSIGELFSTLSEKFSQLVRDEIRLAKAEMAEKAKNAGAGLGLFAGAGVLAFFAVGTLVATLVLALDLVLPAWAAALVVALLLLAIAGGLGYLGKTLLERGSPPIPEKAQESIKADVEAVKKGLS
ncbi:MAG TPA: phage holin family protein [Actinotalea sp.]|nr:phage holin family protein [Actinotalea sp.]